MNYQPYNQPRIHSGNETNTEDVPILNDIPMMLPIHTQIENKLKYFLSKSKIPHIIFHGNSGTGKRTLVYNFINNIYGFDKSKIKTNVMFVNCAHGKGIKFIREELKFFAKTNIQSKCGVLFKTIVLMNADFLTIDAQSALRRCIELFSHNTRFFIIVENKHKLLNPIISRFCEIYVPEYVVDGKVINLHQHNMDRFINTREHEKQKQMIIENCLLWFDKDNKTNISHHRLATISNHFYENGVSCLDFMEFIHNSGWWRDDEVIPLNVMFHKIKSEYRCEKLLMLYMLDFIYLREDNDVTNIQ